MSKRQASDELTRLSAHYAECVEWLLACPFYKADAFFETSVHHLEPMGEEMEKLAALLDDSALLESIQHALREGEFGDFDAEPAFWRYISLWADGKVLK